MKPARAAVLAALALAGCERCAKQPDPTEPVASVRRVPFEAAPAALAPLPEWADAEGLEGVALPAGCRVELPVRHAPLATNARFVAVRGRTDALALRNGGRALFDLARKRALDVPWEAPDEPPHLARTGERWLAALSRPGEALLWQSDGSALEVARGDRMRAVDLACSNERCALLTPLARKAESPGATVAIGDPRDASSWKKVDLEVDPAQPWAPLSIVSFDGKQATVVLGSGDKTAVWRGQQKLGEVASPFGAWDVVETPAPLVIAAGQATEGGSCEDVFPLRLAPIGKPAIDVTVSVPPDSVIARPLSKGALVAWVAPVSCKIDRRVVVYALRVGEGGKPLSSPTGVADATGFALATQGDELSLWLRTERGITWVRGRCGD